MPFRDEPSVYALLRHSAARKPDQPAIKWFASKTDLETMTWAAFDARVRKVAASLMRLGVKKGDKVAIIANTRPEWVMADLGTNAIGALTVGIYQSNLPKDVHYIVDHSESVVVFAENETQLAKLQEIRKEIPAVRQVVLFSGKGPADDSWVMGLEDFLSLGRDVPASDLDARIAQVSPADPAGIIYTSGTTGVPKGAVLTHDNLIFTARSVMGCAEIHDSDECFLFLPLAHVFARTCFYTALTAGVTVVFFRSLETIAEDLKVARPHWFVSVPRIFEKVHGKILGAMEQKGGATLKLFRWACRVGDEMSRNILDKRQPSLVLRLQYALADRLVFSKIRAAFGGRLRWCISGAAPLNPDIGRFFHACGILVLEGLGMTENTSFSNVNRPDNYRFGWVGPPGPGIEQKLCEDGEILFKGRNVMKEYYKMPEATAETFTEDGWLRTGDIGEIDDKNFLRVTGRKKEILITTGGKNIPPAPLESALVTSRYINQAFVVGDRRQYLTAVVTLDMENVKTYANGREMDVSDTYRLMRDPEIQRLVEGEVRAINAQFPSYETIKKVAIVPEFSIENGLLTPTLKLKKQVALERFKSEIEGLYEKE